VSPPWAGRPRTAEEDALLQALPAKEVAQRTVDCSLTPLLPRPAWDARPGIYLARASLDR